MKFFWKVIQHNIDIKAAIGKILMLFCGNTVKVPFTKMKVYRNIIHLAKYYFLLITRSQKKINTAYERKNQLSNANSLTLAGNRQSQRKCLEVTLPTNTLAYPGGAYDSAILHVSDTRCNFSNHLRFVSKDNCVYI